ncbi:hypothetical protein RHSIM_Rhsim06G0083200 [Rhododendron simsii]|uniref:Uncharacterized protein n=1 Tax=Rhododendron simsii TaxID=118357 RepID=A0A834LLG9_RHOSS|nr:hypothetical protein RHSIM_Rhsim06G0083200 [Rhododendron simsii]
MATVNLSGFSAVAVLKTGPKIGRNFRSFFFKPLLTSPSASSTVKTTSRGKFLASSTAAIVTEPVMGMCDPQCLSSVKF